MFSFNESFTRDIHDILLRNYRNAILDDLTRYHKAPLGAPFSDSSMMTVCEADISVAVRQMARTDAWQLGLTHKRLQLPAIQFDSGLYIPDNLTTVIQVDVPSGSFGYLVTISKVARQASFRIHTDWSFSVVGEEDDFSPDTDLPNLGAVGDHNLRLVERGAGLVQ